MHKTILAILLMFASVLASAQDKKVAVSVSHSGKDNVGNVFAFSVREAIRSSSGYTLAGGDNSALEIAIATLDPDDFSRGDRTVASITILMMNFNPIKKGEPHTWYPIFMTSLVATIGSKRTDEEAKSVLATLDRSLEKYRSDLRK